MLSLRYRKQNEYHIVMLILDAVKTVLNAKRTKRVVRSLIEEGHLLDGVRLAHKTLKFKKRDPDFVLLVAAAFTAANKLTAAQRFYDLVLRDCPEDLDALVGIGNVMIKRKNSVEAQKYFTKACKIGPSIAAPYLGLAESFRWQQQYPRALHYAELAIEFGGNADAWVIKADAHVELRDFDKGESSFRRALELNPKHFVGLSLLAQLLLSMNKADSAIDLLESNCYKPQWSATVWNALGIMYAHIHDYSKSIDSYKTAIVLTPNDSSYWKNIGIAYRDSGNVVEAYKCFERSLELNTSNYETIWHKSLCDMLLHKFQSGWAGYEYRKFTKDHKLKSSGIQEWKGPGDKCDSLLVIGEQGIGDEIMFAQFLPETLEYVGRISLACTGKLKRVFELSFPEVNVVELTRDYTFVANAASNTEIPFDRTISIGSLAQFFSSEDNWVTPRQSYLKISEIAKGYWQDRMTSNDKVKVGISWRGGVPKTRSNLRSIEAESLIPMLGVEGCEFYSLQYGDVSDDLRFFKLQGRDVKHLISDDMDYEMTAALAMHMDVVISVQTALVHLSGALGVRTIALIAYGPEWRYGISCKRLPWYQSVQLIRQSYPGDWADVLTQATDQLSTIVSGRNITNEFI